MLFFKPEVLYELYYDWVKTKSVDNRSEANKKYLELYPSLPKKKRKAQAEEEEREIVCPMDK